MIGEITKHYNGLKGYMTCQFILIVNRMWDFTSFIEITLEKGGMLSLIFI